MSLNTGAAPLYVKIKEHIVQQIADRILKKGERIPSENDLVAQFGVSRMTVNKALSELKREGLLTRVSGVGTFVTDTKPHGHLITIGNIADEVRQRGHKYHLRLIYNKKSKANKDIARKLDINIGAFVFHTKIVHLENDLPIQLEDRYVAASAAPDYENIDFKTTTPSEYLLANVPLHKVKHRVKAIMPDEDVAKLLEMSSEEPCLLLIRQTWGHRHIVSYSRLTHPGSRYEFDDTFEPS